MSVTFCFAEMEGLDCKYLSEGRWKVLFLEYIKNEMSAFFVCQRDLYDQYICASLALFKHFVSLMKVFVH